jgi:predicted permease
LALNRTGLPVIVTFLVALLAIRRIRRSPALAVAIVLTLGLGVGVSAAIVSASVTALAGTLPYADAARLMHLWELRPETGERTPASYPTLADWRARTSHFSALEGYDPANFTVGVGNDTRMLRGAAVTTGFFRLLGVSMSGRDFLKEDSRVAIVTERFVQAHAGGPALDRTITVNGVSRVIVGVLPPAFHFGLLQNADMFVPLVVDADRALNRTDRSVHVVGRLRAGAGEVPARDELAGVMADLAREYPDALRGRSVAAESLRDAILGRMKPVLTALLLAVVLLVTAIGANLALLTLARYMGRAPELAMQAALGATRPRLLRDLLVESLLPGLAGAALAVVIARLTTHWLLGAIPDGVRIGMPYLGDAALGGWAITAIAGAAIALSAAFTAGPALLVTSRQFQFADRRTTVSRGERRLRRGLVAAQMSLAVVLLVSSALLAMSFRNLVHRNLGFDAPDDLISVRAPLSGDKYGSDAAQQQFYEALLEKSVAVPGVIRAGLINEVPGGGGGMTSVDLVDRPLPPATRPRVALRIVGGEYFRTMGIPVLKGRGVETRDRAGAPAVAVISASAARHLALDDPASGRKLRLGATRDTEWEVVGSAGDVQGAAVDAESPPVVYVSHLQAAENRMMLVLRTRLDAGAVETQVREIVKRLDAGVPVYAAATIARQLSDSGAVFSRRFPMLLCGLFAAAALALTLVALYAICLHDVVTRRREFGIRMALGGTPRAIRRLVFGDVIVLGAAGVGIGVVAAVFATRSLQTMLFGVTPDDWRVYAAVAAAVLVCAGAATLGPARRAGSVDPAVVMRED